MALSNPQEGLVRIEVTISPKADGPPTPHESLRLRHKRHGDPGTHLRHP